MGHWLSLERLSNTDQMRACAGWSDSSMDSGPVLLRHPIFFVIFRTYGGSGPAVPPLDPCMIRGLFGIQVFPKHAIHLRCCVRSKTLSIIELFGYC